MIIERNARIGRGELDLIISIDGEAVAVEVKTGSDSDGNDPIYHFDDDKQYQVRSLAGQRGMRRVDYVGVTVSADGVTVRWLPGVC